MGSFRVREMAESLRVWLKKIFSLTLILNALITLAAISGMLYGLYALHWDRFFPPYLINGNLLWIAAAAGIINIFPSAAIGRKLHTGRFLFHHYMYGFFVLITSSVCVILFTSVSLIMLFFINTANIAINAGKCFLLIGFTLLLDDLPDVSKRLERALNKIKCGFCHVKKSMHVLQLITGIGTFYIFLAILASSISNRAFPPQNVLTMSTFAITSLTSFALVKRRAWLKITPPDPTATSAH